METEEILRGMIIGALNKTWDTGVKESVTSVMEDLFHPAVRVHVKEYLNELESRELVGQVEWVVVETGKEADVDLMVAAVKATGRTCYRVSMKQVFDSDLNFWERGIPLHRNVVCWGPINSIQELGDKYGFMTFMDLGHIDCLKYYAHFGQYLVQSEYVMLPIGDLRRRWDSLEKQLGEDRSLFVRPNQNDKMFTAKCITKRDLIYFDRAGLDLKTLVVVARPKKIKQEWRLFFQGTNFLTGTQYRKDGELFKEEGVPEMFLEQAKQIAERCHYPELPPVWVMDIAEVEDYPTIQVLEVSGSACAGFYDADHIKIINAISEEATKAYGKSFSKDFE